MMVFTEAKLALLCLAAFERFPESNVKCCPKMNLGIVELSDVLNKCRPNAD